MQRTDEWHRQRRGRLTASVMGQALGLTPWGSPKQLAKGYRCTEQAPSQQKTGNVAMAWGTAMEPNGLLEYAIATGCSVEPTGFWQHSELDWIGGSPDGLVGSDGLVEIKCPYTRKLYPELPPHYYCQINALLEITKRSWCDLCVWTPTDLKMWRVRANPEHWQTLLPHYSTFWACVHSGREPPNPGALLLPVVRAWCEACEPLPLTQPRMLEALGSALLKTFAAGDSYAEEEHCEADDEDRADRKRARADEEEAAAVAGLE